MNEQWMGKLKIAGLALLSIFFFWLMTFGDNKEKNEEIEIIAPDEEIFIGEEMSERYVNESELNDTVMKAFLDGLIGTNYKFLLMLFKSEMLDRDIRKMNPTELEEYAFETGEKIKKGKEVVYVRVLEVQVVNEKKIYDVEMEFRDNTRKVITITTDKGSIITPIESLY